MKRLFLMAMLALMIPANPAGTAQEGYSVVQQCDGPNCVPRRVRWQPIMSMPTVSEVVPVVSPPSVIYSAALPAEPAVASPPSSVPSVVSFPGEPVQFHVMEVSWPVAQQPVQYAAPVCQTYQAQARPLVLPRLFPRIRANMRNRFTKR